MNEIASIAEILVYLSLGASCSDADTALIQLLKGLVEADCRRFCRWNITQPTTPYVHYLPDRVIYGEDQQLLLAYNSGNSTISYGSYSFDGYKLQLPQPWLRSISDLRYDPTAYGGQAPGSFPVSTQLVQGVDWWIDVDSGGLSKDGIVNRIGVFWATIPRSVRVTYISGLTADELDGEYRDIKAAVIEETALRFKMAKIRGGTGGSIGPISQEQFGGEYSVTYDVKGFRNTDLSDNTKMRLEHWIYMAPQP